MRQVEGTWEKSREEKGDARNPDGVEFVRRRSFCGGGLRRDRDDALGRGVGGAPLRAGKVSKIQNDAT